jgi:hypothetical protein
MDLLIRGLAVWRLSRMLVTEDGPYLLLYKLRKKTGIQYTVHGIAFTWPTWNPLVCVLCTSVWVSMVIAVLPGWVSRPLALSGMAALIEDVLEIGSSKNSH